MRQVPLHHIDSFTDKMFGGNPTVTILDAERLTPEEMKSIAIEMNLSETGFVLPSKKGDFKLRFFTRAGAEIKFCGHATVGALCALAKEGRFGIVSGARHSFQVETNAGILPMEADLTIPEKPGYRIEAPEIDLVLAPYSLKEAASALGIAEGLIDFSKPLMLEKTNNYLYFAVSSLENLGKIKLDMPRAIEFAQRDNIVVFCALAQETFEKEHHVHARGFAPLVGVPEDPFTGSMQGGLAAYLLTNKMAPPKIERLVSEQGHFMNRPGSTVIELMHGPRLKAHLLAEAKHLFETMLTLD